MGAAGARREGRSMTCIYGLRIAGTHEPRYIGLTIHSPAVRLIGHLNLARCAKGAPFADWLIANEAVVEAFEIARFTDHNDARRCETDMIKACVRLGHRLFNLHHVPKSNRVSVFGSSRQSQERTVGKAAA